MLQTIYKMAPNTVHVYSPSETALDAARAIGGFFERHTNLWVRTYPCGTMPKILAEMLSRWGPVIAYGCVNSEQKRPRAEVYRGDGGVALLLAGDKRLSSSESRDIDTAVLIGVPARVEAPFGWGVETVSPYPHVRKDFRSKFAVAELLRLFTEFCDKLFPYMPEQGKSFLHRQVTEHAVETYVREQTKAARERTQPPADLTIVHDFPKLGEMREILYTTMERADVTLIGGVRLVDVCSVEDYYGAVNTWCDFFSEEPVRSVEELVGAKNLLTPNGTRIHVESYMDIDCAGITNNGKYVWWFCGKTFHVVTSDGEQLIYRGEHESSESHDKYTGISIGGDIPTAIYRGNDGALWFEMSDAGFAESLPYNSNVGGILTWLPSREPFLKLAIRLADTAPQSLLSPVTRRNGGPAQSPFFREHGSTPHAPDGLLGDISRPRRAPAALKQTSREYHDIKHTLLSRIRCGEMPNDNGIFLLLALKEMDEEMLRWIFSCITRGLYHVDVAILDSVDFGPEYSVLHRRMRESLSCGFYYRSVPIMEIGFD